jgi:acyl-coenzyme A synthetase/AMP-(fatty) acid ligase
MLPSLYGIVLRSGLRRQVGALDTVIVAGEECTPELVRRHFATAPDVRLYNEYGPTEYTVWATWHECRPADQELPKVPIGRPIPGARAYVRGADGAPAGVDEPGELYLDGPGLAEPERLPIFGGLRLYRTGDYVSRTADGLLIFHGRQDDQLKLGGMRVGRDEIEAALAGCDGVALAAIGVDRSGDHPKIVGYVVLTDGAELDVRALRTQMFAALPAVAIPSRIEAVSNLPLLPNGKVDRSALDREVADQ